jgi:hypothetical protein
MSERKQKNETQALSFPAAPEAAQSSPLQSWALVELFGHQRIVGHVTVDPIEFPGMVRVDVPDLLKNGILERKGHTRYIARAAIYALNPCDEQTVQTILPHVDGLPARPMSLREEW